MLYHGGAAAGRVWRHADDKGQGEPVRHAYLFLLAALLIAGQAAADTPAGRDAFQRSDFETALKELTPEADKGDPEALYLLARMHQAGFGVPKDLAKAAAYFGKAAERDYADAQYAYAQILMLGEGINQNVVEGVKWLFIAARMNGHEGASKQLEKLPTSREVAIEARKAAYEWMAEKDKKIPAGGRMDLPGNKARGF